MKAAAVALVLSLSLLGAERASAADLPLPGGAPIPPSSYYPISPPVNWGGVYIGLNGGYGLGRSNWTNSRGSTGNFADNGGLVGGTLGINYAGFGDWVLLGFEGDFDWSGATGSAACCQPLAVGGAGTDATCQTRIDWLTTFRLRAGYTWSHFLFYATAGGAAGDFRLSTNPSGALATIQRRRSAGRRAPASNTSSPTRSAPRSSICTSIWARLAVRRARSAVPTMPSQAPARCPSTKT